MASNPQNVERAVEKAVAQVVEHTVAQTVEQALLQQVASINRQLESMAASRADIVRRLQTAGREDAVRLQESLAQQDASVVELHGRLEEVNEKLVEIKSGIQHVMEVPPPDYHPPLGISQEAFTSVFVMLAIGIIVPLSVGLTRRLWRRPQPVAPAAREADLAGKTRLDRLEQSVDAIAIEIERISEGQRFVTKVLTERQVTVRPASNVEAGPAALNEGTPFLALGAGPIEPIRAAERQAVKQSITPH